MSKFTIKKENTAITNGVSKSAKIVSQEIEKTKKILDYGCGKLRNTIFLLNQGFHVDAVDTQVQILNLQQKYLEAVTNLENIETLIKLDRIYEDKEFDKEEEYDICLCSFVLNVVSEKDERKEIIQKIYRAVKKGGLIYIETRTDKDILKAKHKEIYKDGFIIGNGRIRTFQKQINEVDLLQYFGFKYIENIKITIINYPNSIIYKITKGIKSV